MQINFTATPLEFVAVRSWPFLPYRLQVAVEVWLHSRGIKHRSILGDRSWNRFEETHA